MLSEKILGMAIEIQRVSSGGPDGWLPVIAGLVLGLLGIGLPMIGVTINLWLGFVILAIAFVLIAWGCWIWEREWPLRKVLRIITICAFAVVYFSLVGVQIRAQYKKDHSVIPPAPPLPVITTPAPPIIQTATDSPCANQVAQSGSQINCNAKKGDHDKPKDKH